MGTTYLVKYLPSGVDKSPLEVGRLIQDELEQVNQQMSTYLPDSEVSRFNQYKNTDWFEVSSDTASVVSLALEISDWSQGAFDVTVGPLVDLWGFGPETPPQKQLSQEIIDATLARVGYENLHVRLDPPALRKDNAELHVDLSAIAKGHGVDRVATVLEKLGAKSFFVEIGGEVIARGRRADGQPWQVGIEQPVENKREIQQVIGLEDRALATSGDYRNFYVIEGKRFSHTIDPHSGWPVESPVASASVLAESCALADGLATCMMAMGSEGLMLANNKGWAVMRILRVEDKLTVEYSQEFDRQLSTSSAH
ncbi:MAG: FAD:protein FMN transferase [Planctomycetales bacterium]|nr:FAD:protein FMN transferase [Planctomycetales bacterium]